MPGPPGARLSQSRNNESLRFCLQRFPSTEGKPMSEIRPSIDPRYGSQDDIQVQYEEVELQEARSPEPSQTSGDIPAPVKITKRPPRKDRKELRYDYRGDRSIREIRFSDLRFNSDEYKTPEDYLGHVV